MKKQLLDIINDNLLKDTEFILLNEDDYYVLFYKGTKENITGSVLNQWENMDELLIGRKSDNLFQFLCNFSHYFGITKAVDYNTFKSLISDTYEELMLKLQIMGFW
jgi:hypothetical protein